jgi:hypothetical protein
MRSKADIGNEKAQRWGTGLIGNISRSAIGATLSAGQSSCLYNIEHRQIKFRAQLDRGQE